MCTLLLLFLIQLYNIVVDTEETAKLLLEHGQLKRRYTFIPLSKIQSRPISVEVVKRAQSLVFFLNVYVHIHTSKQMICVIFLIYS